jgi:hypothetical protein
MLSYDFREDRYFLDEHKQKQVIEAAGKFVAILQQNGMIGDRGSYPPDIFKKVSEFAEVLLQSNNQRSALELFFLRK